MAIDILQERIRKLKNPSMVDFRIQKEHLPNRLLNANDGFLQAYGQFCSELMEALCSVVPAVRFSFDCFALHGSDGFTLLSQLLHNAKQLGFYVLLDGPHILSPWAADQAAELILGGDAMPCDGLLISPYIGSDSIKPFIPFCKNTQKDLFVVVRSPNKSAVDVQDLLTGTRHVYGAVAEMVSRFGEGMTGKCGYSSIAAAVSAGSPQSIQTLRPKHNRMFMLVDGLDYPSGNAKNCSYAFDRFGHGAVVCAGPSVTAAWKESGEEDSYIEKAVQAAERMKKNITRYISIL